MLGLHSNKHKGEEGMSGTALPAGQLRLRSDSDNITLHASSKKKVSGGSRRKQRHQIKLRGGILLSALSSPCNTRGLELDPSPVIAAVRVLSEGQAELWIR